MPEIPDVIPLATVQSTWGNKIRSRVLQRYANLAGRSSLSPSPEAGELSYLQDTGEIAVYHGGSWRGLVPAGSLIPYAGATAPPGWLLANGALVSRSTYAALFAAIGTAFGAGDGSTTFGLPDMRGRFPLGMAASGTGSTRGGTGGDLGHTHTGPAHTHNMVPHVHPIGTHTHNIDPAPVNTTTVGVGGSTSSAGSHGHSYSDSTGGASATNSTTSGPQSGATGSHSHSFSGSTSSGGAHTHTIDGDHAHSVNIPTTESGNPLGGNTGADSGAATGAAGSAATGTADPPFLAIPYIIKI